MFACHLPDVVDYYVVSGKDQALFKQPIDKVF